MLFNSVEFIIFFPIVVGIYFLVPNKIKKYWLLLSSYYFYMCWNLKYILLILASTLITYFSGILIEKSVKSGRTGWKKAIVAISLISNLLILAVFKYFNFFGSVLQAGLSLFKFQITFPRLDLLLPVGISFYTFQALSYTLDVYRGQAAEKNPVDYALFVSFFPQLVAGPIERSSNLLPQFKKESKFDYDCFREGFFLMLWGYFLKIVIADRIALFVNTVYDGYETYTGFYLIVATLLFAVQIYCDFCGYSTIALGAALILGIRLTDNFHSPYLSATVADFWRRWHVTLGSWFKDNLYVPLGGNRKGSFRKMMNVMTVFLVSGLWHGASLSYVIWGGINGLYQVIGELLSPIRQKIRNELKINVKKNIFRMAKIFVTFLLVDFSWIFFRSDNTGMAVRIIKSVFMADNFQIFFDGSILQCGLDGWDFLLLSVCILILVFSDYCKQKNIVVRKMIISRNYWFRCLFITCAVCAILLFGKWGPSFDNADFIYFQF